jgi:hypothetical protein
MVLSSAIHIKLSKTTMDNVYLDTINLFLLITRI